jgi:hypothetical protein
MKLADLRQQLCPGRSWHPLTGQDHADQAPVVTEPGEQAERIIGGPSADDLVIGSVPLAELSLDDTAGPRIFIGDQQDWSIWHAGHL